MVKPSRLRKGEAKQQTLSNSNIIDGDSDDNNNGGIKDALYTHLALLSIENEMMDLYTKQFGYDPREPQTYKYFPEEEQIERHAQNVMCWRRLNAEYNVK